MQTSVRNSPVADACVGSAYVCGSARDSLRRSGSSSSSTSVGSATPFPSRSCSADERIRVSASTLTSHTGTYVFPAANAGEPHTSAGRQPSDQVDARRQTTAALTQGGPRRNRRATTSRRAPGSYESFRRRRVLVLRVMKTSFERMRRWMARYPSRRYHGLPLPHAVADVRRFLDALYYEEICFLILRTCLTLMHTGVLLYSCMTEEPFRTYVPAAPLLAVLAVLTLLRVLCQYQIVRALSRLRWAWWERTILADFVKLLRSPLWQCQRVLFIVSFSFYFVALHLAYYRGPVTVVDMAHAPVLLRYVSIVVLGFLSVLGPHILMLVIVCTSLIVCWCASAADIEQLLVEEPRGASRALPARLLQTIHEEHWMPPEHGSRRSSSISDCTSNSGRDSGTTHVINKQLQDHQQGGGQSKSASARTGERLDKEEGTGKRRIGCESNAADRLQPSANGGARVRSDFTCAICLTEFLEGDVVRRLPCSHVFHSACITRWLSSHASCPLRCYVNFFTAHANHSPFDASRHLRALSSQLLRRPRFRFLSSVRQRQERQLRERRSLHQRADLGPGPEQQERQHQGEQDHEYSEENRGECAAYEGAGLHRNVQCPDEVPSSPDSSVADYIHMSKVAERSMPVEHLGDTNGALAAPTELQEHFYPPNLQHLSSVTPTNGSEQCTDETSEEVNVAVEALSEGGKSDVFFPCFANEANTIEHDTYFVRVEVTNPQLQDNSEKPRADQNRPPENVQDRSSSPYTHRRALESPAVSASLESTVAASVSSTDKFSDCFASQCDTRIFSQDNAL